MNGKHQNLNHVKRRNLELFDYPKYDNNMMENKNIREKYQLVHNA